MKNSNLEEQHTEVEVPLEESDMEETREIVSEIGVGNSRDPYIGKEFLSLDDSFKFYLDYAHRSGFSVRRGHMTKSKKDKINNWSRVCLFKARISFKEKFRK
ncbi:hypothetical protein R3W88_012577 [Solanum pinnatisectum]|uniref:FAR1 domain-containing protein n=1 Tax=Solanum pinnatisectum TaxID=50273 RepID=A0AAV9LCB5_9SOLN|nr:hypothetical protein R3W88_012577 [Solanum pinnatisectum]